MVRSGEVSCSDLQRAPSHWVLLVSHLVRGLIPSWGSTLMTIANSNHLPKALLQMPPHCGVRGSTYGFGGGHYFLSHSVCNLPSSGACSAPGVPCPVSETSGALSHACSDLLGQSILAGLTSCLPHPPCPQSSCPVPQFLSCCLQPGLLSQHLRGLLSRNG